MTPVKFHVSLNVTDPARSVAFYKKLLDRDPVKQTRDYAKFELEDPPLVLSLLSGRPNSGGNLNHAGLRLPDADSLVAWQRRLEMAGLATQREEGVECCHSRQTKFWVTDPDRTLWEIYIFHEDAGEHDHDAPSVCAAQTKQDSAPKVTWQHQIPEPFPARIPHEDNSVHEVILEGTANLKPAAVNLAAVLAEACRVLRPGGELRLHGLAGDKSFLAQPNLPGPAAVVEHVPVEAEPVRAMVEAGFVQIRFEKLSPGPNFMVDGVRMREFLLVGAKPGHRPRNATHQAIYLGPLAQVVDDFGNVFRRGERTELNIHDWQILGRCACAGQFLLLAPERA